MKKILLALFLLSFAGNLKAQQTCSDIPVINNFSPTVGFIGSIVTINGANFDPVNIQNNVVFFGASKAEVLSATFGKLEVIVPVGASTAPISVTNRCNLTAFSQVAFNGIFCSTPVANTTYNTNGLTIPVTNGSYNLASADFNGDKKPEIISGGQSAISIAVNNSTPGNLSFTAMNLAGSSYAGNVVPADMDGDGLLDIVTQAQIFRNTSTGSTVSFASPIAKSDVAGYQVFVADINKDGKLGVFAASFGVSSLEKLGLYKFSKQEYGFFDSFPVGIEKGKNQLLGYGKQLKAIFTPSTGAYKGVGGFKAIFDIFPKTWSWEIFWNITALLSIMLGVMNLLPIPALDGGHVMFLLYEMITRRKPSDKFMENAQMVGFVLLITLLLFANGNDIYKAIFHK